MPSLRRTVSSPMVRASPYHYPSSLSGGSGTAQSTTTRIRRACSGSEPNAGRRTRAVLADIEWWRVLDGQHPEGNENEHGDEENGENDAGVDQDQVREIDNEADAIVASALEPVGGMMYPQEWDAGEMDVTVGEPGALSITTPFAALSISSMLPTTPPRRNLRREASDTSDVSSTESTPDPSLGGIAFADALSSMGSMGIEGVFGLGSDHSYAMTTRSTASSTRADMFSSALLPDAIVSSRRPSSLGAAFMLRSVSFNGFDTPRESFDDRFGDVCL